MMKVDDPGVSHVADSRADLLLEGFDDPRVLRVRCLREIRELRVRGVRAARGHDEKGRHSEDAFLVKDIDLPFRHFLWRVAFIP